MNPNMTCPTGEIRFRDGDLQTRLDAATESLREMCVCKPNFLKVLAKMIAKLDIEHHQVFHLEGSYFYGLIACTDQAGLLIGLSMESRFLIDPRPEHVAIEVYRKYPKMDANDALSGAPIVWGLEKVQVTRRGICWKTLLQFSDHAFVMGTFHHRLGDEILSGFV